MHVCKITCADFPSFKWILHVLVQPQIVFVADCMLVGISFTPSQVAKITVSSAKVAHIIFSDSGVTFGTVAKFKCITGEKKKELLTKELCFM